MWVEGVRLGLIILQWAFLFPCKLFPCYESLNELFNFIWCDAPYFHFHPYSKENQNKSLEIVKKENKAKEEAPKHIVQVPTALFFQYNTQLGPPYHVLVDTNFINFSIKNKLEVYKSMMDCLLAKCIPCITDCVMAELEKLGTKYRLALRLAKDPRFERLPCTHAGTYADDCLLQRCQQHRCYIVATCDKELKRKIRKVRYMLQYFY